MQDERTMGTGADAGLGSSGGPGMTGSGTTQSSRTPSSGGMAGGGGRTGDMGGLRDTVSDLGSRADEIREQAAERLETAAERLDRVADKVPQKGLGTRATTAGHGMADALEAVARFLRDNDMTTLQRELGSVAAQRPVSLLLLAAGAGFVVGKVLR